LPSPASPTLRALRRLVGRDPETPIRLEFGGTRASLAATLRAAVRPLAGSVAELLGGDRAARTAAATAGADSAPRVTGPGRALDGPLVLIRRHRRLVPLTACLLLVAVAAVGAIPPVSAAGGAAPTPGDSSAIGSADTNVTDQPVDQAQANAGVDSNVDPNADPNLDDGTVYNVIQTVDIAPGSSDFQTYVVKGGDSLNKIAVKYGLVRNTVYWANTTRLPNPASISIGLKLLIPPVDGITVTVKASNTLSGFASKYKVSVQKIMSANGMSDATLTVGQLLVIPVAQVPAIPTPKPAERRWRGGGVAARGGPARRLLMAGAFQPHDHAVLLESPPAIDIGAPTGAPVVAAVRGTVIFAGWKYSGSAGYGGGLVVWISSGGKLYTTYNHLSPSLCMWARSCRPASASATSERPVTRPGRISTSRFGPATPGRAAPRPAPATRSSTSEPPTHRPTPEPSASRPSRMRELTHVLRRCPSLDPRR
jgi:LysM repeat protein